MTFVTNPNANKIYGGNGTGFAAAGIVGEPKGMTILSGAAVGLSSGVDTPVGSVVLTPGIWIPFVNAAYSNSGGAIQQLYCSVNTVNNARPDFSRVGVIGLTNNYLNVGNVQAPMLPIAVNANTTYYFMTNAVFSGGTTTVCGNFYFIRFPGV